MENSMQDRLEQVELQPSQGSERMLIQVGISLYDALVTAVRHDEVELLVDIIGEYSTMVSFYGSKTSRLPESLAVDLNEAALLRLDELSSEELKEWRAYADRFINSLRQAAKDLDI